MDSVGSSFCLWWWLRGQNCRGERRGEEGFLSRMRLPKLPIETLLLYCPHFSYCIHFFEDSCLGRPAWYYIHIPRPGLNIMNNKHRTIFSTVSYDAINTADGVNPRARRVLEKSDGENCFRGKCCVKVTVSTSTVKVCPATNSATSRSVASLGSVVVSGCPPLASLICKRVSLNSRPGTEVEVAAGAVAGAAAGAGAGAAATPPSR